MTKKALIIGGGIAGPVTAMALQRAGVDSEIFESYGHGAGGVGVFLTLAVNGLEALRVLGLHDQVCELGMDSPRMETRNARGRVLASLHHPSRTIKRADLYRVLRDEAVRRGVRVHYGRRLDDATITPGGVRAVFADGSTAEGDLLIGADGLRSRTRTIIDPGAPRARHVGLLNTGGFARGVEVPGEPGTYYFIFGRRCFFGYAIHPDGEVWWFANPPSRREPTREELAAITPERWRATLTELFAGDTGPMLDIIGATEHIPPGWNTYDFPTVPTWSNERMVIVGDAAHAASPSSGQGASMAIEDAVVLAKCLRDVPGTGDAFAAYERLRRGRVERIVAQGRRNGSGKAPGPAGAFARDLMMPVIMRWVAAKNPMAWIHDHRISWDDPVAAVSR
ncbi:FAD-dependent oxidoreductase [Planomonospora venezuelensis]|uniref:2-polyprenyl-6-methoxyphenol hydroxylase-like FAD-dependent oxidoreductase n=1 Tax=Planomonospora venezuelensis TaxID=1999 RepID=A0A841DCT1_PLAVE|nr:NAD(P)/FAD-dependent oxidoreductase [Planomonospora venezuelensis]MBB5967931.1 2-polyprenyl-6-methoxyphenol hydroxylase-like FAD-dependent oxidoreductase [Planomonospora venezuelensis]GIN03340.1 FAD-dependent oxidoreductase [Planomonospora venezuelensis]